MSYFDIKDLQGSYFYEEKRITKTKKSKICDICGSNIPIRSGHLVFKMYRDEYYDFDICNECEQTKKSLLTDIRNIEY